MKVFHLSAECYPVAKVGGLADVVGALPKYQNQMGLDAAVVLPFYDRKFVHDHEFETLFEGSALLGSKRYEFQIWKEAADTLGFKLFLIYVPGLLDRPEVYSYPDEREQFIIFQLAFLDWIYWSQQKPDLIHCHDHHVGLIPFLLQHSGLYKRLSKTPTVFTIHNGQYHGAFGYEKFNYLPEVDMRFAGLLDWANGINPLACAVRCADKYTTVSPSYLEELSHNSNGLEYLFYLERAKGLGIINGIDTEVWNAQTDPMLSSHINAKQPDKGKLQNKTALCERFGLPADKPLIAFIGRLVVEKGADLLAEAIAASLSEHAGEVSFLILGAGDAATESELQALHTVQNSANYKTYIGYNEQLAHLIYAGADFLLMPSRVEPCGLNQLYALRYGTVPIVRRTGGLKDTVLDFGDPGGYGICFNQDSVEDITYSVSRAITLYQDSKQLQLLRKRMMALDFSWNQSARQYVQLYESLKPTI